MVRTKDARPYMLEVDGLSLRLGELTLFSGWSCRIGAGVTLVQGGEGTGKSTLLRLLAGAQAADAGDLRLCTVPLATRAQDYRRQVYLADPRSEAHDQISALGYLDELRAQHPHFDAQAVAALFEGLSLTEHQDKPLYMLSTGSRRKVWFAGAVVSGAPLTLVDDPFAALDRRSIACVLEVLRGMADSQARAWVLADYEAPPELALSATIDLG